MECLAGVEGGRVTGEIHLNPHAIIEDAAGIVLQKKGTSCALPAPHLLGITDTYYHDEQEWNDAIAGVYRDLMRSMRDTGIKGHVLICREDLRARDRIARPPQYLCFPAGTRPGEPCMPYGAPAPDRGWQGLC